MKTLHYMAAIIALLFAFDANAKTATEIFDHVSQSMVVVFAHDDKGKMVGMGSGVALPDGSVATNHHVIENAARIFVRCQKEQYPATVRHADPKRDVCIIAVSGLKCPAVTLGSTLDLKVGARVYVIGTPMGLELTLSEGIVSSLRVVEGAQLIQTTAPISPGASGCGMFDENGLLIGMMSLYSEGDSNLNFALPVEWIMALAQIPAENKSSVDAQVPAETPKTDTSQAEWVSKAEALEAKKDWQHLVLHAQSWTEVLPDSAPAWFCLGRVYWHSGQAPEAIEAYNKVVRIDPDHVQAWNNLGVAYRQSGQIEKAAEAYRQALRIDPGHARAWTNLGNLYIESGQAAKAIEAYQEALRLEPENARAWYGLGVASGNAGQADKAIEAYQKALRLEPENSRAWNNLGNLYSQSGQAAKAIEAYQQALRIEPKHSKAWYNLANVYVSTGDTTNAIEAYQQALRVDSNYAKAWYQLGVLYRQTGQADKTKEIYQTLKTLDPASAEEFFTRYVLP